MIKSINDSGKEFYSEALESDLLSADLFHDVDMSWSDGNTQVAFHCNLGSITVLNRMTGYGCGVRDIETGYREPDGGKFWLASGNFDIRNKEPMTIGEAIDCIKRNANNMRGE